MMIPESYFQRHDFAQASREIVQFLHQKTGFGLWMVTRTEGQSWIVLTAEDHGYGVTNGTVFQWADSFCSRMVQQLGPSIAYDSHLVEAYAMAPIADQVDIRSYMGAPLLDADGELFGTLCGIDPKPRDPSLQDELPLLQLLAKLLTSILISDRQLQSLVRKQNKMDWKGFLDPETGFYHHRFLNTLIEAEDATCQKYGQPAAVISIKAMPTDQELGTPSTLNSSEQTDFLQLCRQVIEEEISNDDFVIRMADDSAIVICVNVDAMSMKSKVSRIRSAMSLEQMQVNVDFAVREPHSDLFQTIQKARPDLAEFLCP